LKASVIIIWTTYSIYVYSNIKSLLTNFKEYLKILGHNLLVKYIGSTNGIYP